MALRVLINGLFILGFNFFSKHQKTYLVHLICSQKLEFSSVAMILTHRSILYVFYTIKWKSPFRNIKKKTTDVLYLNVSIFLPPKKWMLFPQQIWLVNQKEAIKERSLWPLCQGKSDYSMPKKAIFMSVWWSAGFLNVSIMEVKRETQESSHKSLSS